jgi:hypothetical protein
MRADFFLLIGCNNNEDECVDLNDSINFIINENLVATFNIHSLENQTNKWIDKYFEFIPVDLMFRLKIEFKREKNLEKQVVFGLDDLLITSICYYLNCYIMIVFKSRNFLVYL